MNAPICAVCNKPVDQIEWFDDPANHVRVFRVFCHGKIEEQTLTDQMLFRMVPGTEIAVGKAFTSQARAIEKKGDC